jgi:hypothetical protein
MPDDVRIRLEGCLEQVESWRDAMRRGLDEARKRSHYGALIEALERVPAEAERAVRGMLSQAPELRRLVDEIDRLRDRAEKLVAVRARRLCLPAGLLHGARALEAEPVELDVGLVDGIEVGKRVGVAVATVAFLLLGVVSLRYFALSVLAVALLVGVYQLVRTTVHVIVTRRRVLIGQRVLHRAGLNRSTLEASLEGMLPQESVAEVYDTLWPPARSRGHD